MLTYLFYLYIMPMPTKKIILESNEVSSTLFSSCYNFQKSEIIYKRDFEGLFSYFEHMENGLSVYNELMDLSDKDLDSYDEIILKNN